ncbi:MAG: succinate dehydrogenase, cytochrome b556 subunit [Thermodesulfovibrio sp.]|nr:succinate dehydrogenase, cytochrome b556 subunit [Thermodesulfovibrio sp.]
MRYRWSTGSLTWLIHRITGVILTFYLIAHIYVLSHLKDPQSYNEIMALMKNPAVKISELILLAVVLKHAFAGLRITLFELGVSTKYQKSITYLMASLVALLWSIGAFYFIKEAL